MRRRDQIFFQLTSKKSAILWLSQTVLILKICPELSELYGFDFAKNSVCHPCIRSTHKIHSASNFRAIFFASSLDGKYWPLIGPKQIKIDSL